MNPEQISQPNHNEKILNLPEIDKNLQFNERLDELFENKILTENNDGKKYILQTLSRIGVIANVNGVKIPFYQSSRGTEGKVSGAWYPFFGNKGAWLIKGKIEDSNRGYDLPEIQEMMKYLDEVLPEYLYINLLTPQQRKIFASALWRKQMGKNEKIKALHKEFIIDKGESAEYMAKVLGYNLKDAPGDGSDPKNIEFMKNVLKSVKQKLEVFKNF